MDFQSKNIWMNSLILFPVFDFTFENDLYNSTKFFMLNVYGILQQKIFFYN